MAEPLSNNADPVAGLIGIPLPRVVSLLPQTWESRLAIALLLAATVIAVWRVVQMRRVNRYRRDALAELSRIERSRDGARSELLTWIALLVRRTALTAFPRERVAPLVGPAWLRFLDHSYDGHEFSEGVGRLLGSGPYRQIPPDDAELTSLLALVRRWIKVHHA